jgi:ferric-dicitrate binding protein FerR (iron transport regulator)
MAFSFVIIAVVSTVIIVSNLGQPIIYQTANKEQQNITLEDGSVVALNAGTILSVESDFNSEKRIVSLQGEAYFNVAKNNKPFIVKTKNGHVQVVGTEFNIKSRKELMVVAVNEGIVRVSSTTAPKDSSLMLTKGQMTYCSRGGYPVAQKPFSTTESPDWLHSKIDLNEERLANVFEEIERRFDVNIKYESHSVDSVRISGLFNTTNLDSLMQSLCILLDKDFKHDDNEVHIY